MEMLRLIILLLGWPILIAGSAFVSYRTYRFYIDVGKNVWGKLVLTMVTGWLITMYSLGSVSTIFMFADLRNGTLVVIPIFSVWFFTMILIIRTVFRWNREAVQVNRFNLQLQTLVDERTRDLSYEKTMAEAERNKLHVIIASISDGIVAIDLDQKITVINPAVERITGYPAPELIGSHILDKLTFFEHGKELRKEEVCRIRTDGFEGIIIHKETVRLKGKNTEKDVSLTVSQIKEGNIANVGCIITLHDKSKDQELEEMKLDFVSMAAHELRTPLTAVRSYISLLQDTYAHNMDDVGKQYMQRLTVSSEMLSALIDNLLQVSRIENNTFKVDRSPVDIIPLIRTTIDGVTTEAQSRHQDISFSPPNALVPLVMADKFRIGQVLTNLLANAIHYTPDEGSISVSVKEVPRAVEIAVTDTGQGIPKEAVPKLFTKFFRISGVLDKGSKGTGLGLYIVKSIIDMHKGTIVVDSEIGKGTTVRFTVPLATGDEIAKYSEQSQRSQNSGALHHTVILQH